MHFQWVDGLRAVVESISSGHESMHAAKEHLAIFDCLVACRRQIRDTETCNANLNQIIENCGASLCSDPDLLILKALSSATTSTLSIGLAHLQKYQEFSRSEMY